MLCVFIALVVVSSTILSCNIGGGKQPWINKFALMRGEKIKPETHLEIMWQDSVTHIFLRKEKQRPNLVVRPNIIWLTLNRVLNNADTLTYHLFDNGGNYIIIKDTLYIQTHSTSPSESDGFLQGWCYKQNNDYPIYPPLKTSMPDDSEEFTFYLFDDKIERRNKKTDVWSVVLTTEQIIGLDINKTKYLFYGLYKWDDLNKRLNKISDNADDIKIMGDGLYFIPPPGTGIHLRYNLKALATKLSAIKDTSTAPDYLE